MTNQILGLVFSNFKTSTQNLALLCQEEKGLLFISQAKQFLACAPTKVFVNIKNPNTNTESSTSVSEFLLMALLLSVDSGGTSKQIPLFPFVPLT